MYYYGLARWQGVELHWSKPPWIAGSLLNTQRGCSITNMILNGPDLSCGYPANLDFFSRQMDPLECVPHKTWNRDDIQNPKPKHMFCEVSAATSLTN